MNIAELMREKILLRTTNPVRAGILTLLISDARNAAKAAKREAGEQDIVNAAKSLKKKLEKTLADLPAGDFRTTTVQEIAELETFMPSFRSEAETLLIIKGIISALPVERKKERAAIMAELKKVDAVDLGMAIRLITTLEKENA